MQQKHDSLRVVLIDDDKVNHMLTKRAFRKAGIAAEFHEFLHASEGLDWIKNTDLLPTCIFLDINMPGMNGWEFLEAYQKVPSKVPIIMLSTSIDDIDRQKAKNWDMVKDFLEKPLQQEDLQRCLAYSRGA